MISTELRTLVNQAVEAQRAAALPLPPPRSARGSTTEQWSQTVAATRALWDGQLLEIAPGARAAEIPVGEIREVTIKVAGGEIGARCYLPDVPAPGPAVVFFHGGGFWMGGGQAGMVLSDPLCRLLSDQLGATVINVDYRLAPEHRYPVSADDCYSAAQWVHDQAPTLGVDRARIALLGISSGANLATVTARRARDRGGPPIRCLTLLMPALDLTGAAGSLREAELNDGLDISRVRGLVELYLSPDDDRHDPDISPGLDPDLSGMPATFVVTGEHDILRLQGEAYAERLRAAGVQAEARRYPMTHSVALPATVATYTTDVLHALTGALAPGPEGA